MKKNHLNILIVTALAGVMYLFAFSKAPALADGQQKTFTTPDEAIRVMLEAFRTSDEQKLMEILGPENKDLITTSDRAQDAYARKKLYALACEKLIREKSGDNKLIILAGNTEWPFPFPLVKEGTRWRFDSAAGREEIINRRVGKNELNAVAVCRLYVKAQREYISRDRNGDDIMEYALKFGSTPGKHDGLYWPYDPALKEAPSPLEDLIRKSSKYTKERKKDEPFYGYYYRILTRQGEVAPGGAYDYIINGHLMAGYAMIAYPANYGTSGVMTFLVNQRGKVYQKDLGADTLKIAQEITSYNPDKGWMVVQENGTLATD